MTTGAGAQQGAGAAMTTGAGAGAQQGAGAGAGAQQGAGAGAGAQQGDGAGAAQQLDFGAAQRFSSFGAEQHFGAPQDDLRARSFESKPQLGFLAAQHCASEKSAEPTVNSENTIANDNVAINPRFRLIVFLGGK